MLIIFSYNDATAIDPILMDRITHISFDKFGHNDKMKIAKEFLIPEAKKALNVKDIIEIPDDILSLIIRDYSTGGGVRELKKCIDAIYTKINLMMHLDNMDIQKKLSNVNFVININNLPIKITSEMARELLKDIKVSSSKPPYGMYV